MATKPSTRNQAKGAARQIKGSAKAVAGKLTRNQRLQAEGKVQAGVGKAQRKLGNVERDFEKDMDRDLD